MEQGDRLYVCGTNAHNPKDYVIYVSPADWEAICHLPFAVFHSCSHTKDCHRQLTLDGNHQLLTQIGTEILPLVLLSPDHIMTIRIGASEFGDNLLAQLIVDWNRTHKPFQLHSVDTFVDADHLRNPLVP